MFSRPMAQGAGAKTGTLAWGINVSNAKSIAFDIIKWIAERDGEKFNAMLLSRIAHYFHHKCQNRSTMSERERGLEPSTL